jgi:hypothetical protein
MIQGGSPALQASIYCALIKVLLILYYHALLILNRLLYIIYFILKYDPQYL